jgi:hypothetical protein
MNFMLDTRASLDFETYSTVKHFKVKPASMDIRQQQLVHDQFSHRWIKMQVAVYYTLSPLFVHCDQHRTVWVIYTASSSDDS